MCTFNHHYTVSLDPIYCRLVWLFDKPGCVLFTEHVWDLFSERENAGQLYLKINATDLILLILVLVLSSSKTELNSC